jgi:hypothetical protein
MKKALIYAGIFVVLIFGGYQFYEFEEIQSQKRLRSNCELGEISRILNTHFRMNGEYPDNEQWLQSILPSIYQIKCGRSLSTENGKLLDPWGHAYKYERKTPTEVSVFSTGSREVMYLLKDGNFGTVQYSVSQ